MPAPGSLGRDPARGRIGWFEAGRPGRFLIDIRRWPRSDTGSCSEPPTTPPIGRDPRSDSGSRNQRTPLPAGPTGPASMRCSRCSTTTSSTTPSSGTSSDRPRRHRGARPTRRRHPGRAAGRRRPRRDARRGRPRRGEGLGALDHLPGHGALIGARRGRRNTSERDQPPLRSRRRCQPSLNSTIKYVELTRSAGDGGGSTNRHFEALRRVILSASARRSSLPYAALRVPGIPQVLYRGAPHDISSSTHARRHAGAGSVPVHPSVRTSPPSHGSLGTSAVPRLVSARSRSAPTRST